MKKILPIIFFIFCSAAFAFNGWFGIKNENFTIFYKKEHEYTAKELMKSLNEVYGVAEKTTGNNINMVYFVIDDFGAVVNGFADPAQSNSIHVFTFSPDSRELAMSENWYKTVGVHEYTHMLQMKNSSGIPDVLTSVFGSNFSFIFIPLSPNFCVPPWIIEGISTYTESQFSKYSGRLNDGYFDAYLLARLKEGKRVNIGDINYSSLGFPYGSYYLYGGLFFRYLSETYGEKKLGDFFDKQGGSLKSYLSPIIPAAGIELNCKSVYGKSFAKLWDEWQEFEIKRAENFKQDGEKITDLKDYSSKTTVYDGWLYYIRQYLDYTSASTTNANYEIWRKNLTTNKDELFYKSTSEILPNLVFNDGYLYFSVENYRTGFNNSSQDSYGVDKRILKLNLSTKEEIEITRDNIRCFTVNSDNSLILSIDKTGSFGSDIYKLTSGSSKVKIADSKLLINEIVTYNNKFFVSAKSQYDNFGIFEFNLSDSSFSKMADTPYLESQISIYDNKLFFISNNNSQYKSYYIDLTTNELFSLTKSGYSTYPSYSKETNKLYYIGINSNGNNIYSKEFSPEKTFFSDYTQKSISDTDFADLKYKKAGYSENLYSLLKPTSRYFALGNSDGKSYYALSLSGSDKVSDIPYYSIYLEYDESKKEKFDFSFSLENNLMLPFKNTLTVDKESFSSLFSYPLLTNSKKGLNSVYGALLLKSENDFKRKTISPIVSLSVKYPDNSLSFYIEAPFEGKSFSSPDNNRLGLISSVKERYSFNNSFIQCDVKSIYNPKNAFIDEDCFPDVRGYSDTFYNNDLIYGSLNYSVNLFKIRRGVWNPNIYAGDISMSLFADTSFERENIKNRQLSSGIEFSTLTGLGFSSLALTPTFRVSFPESKSPEYKFVISTDF